MFFVKATLNNNLINNRCLSDIVKEVDNHANQDKQIIR